MTSRLYDIVCSYSSVYYPISIFDVRAASVQGVLVSVLFLSMDFRIDRPVQWVFFSRQVNFSVRFSPVD